MKPQQSINHSILEKIRIWLREDILNSIARMRNHLVLLLRTQRTRTILMITAACLLIIVVVTMIVTLHGHRKPQSVHANITAISQQAQQMQQPINMNLEKKNAMLLQTIQSQLNTLQTSSSNSVVALDNRKALSSLANLIAHLIQAEQQHVQITDAKITKLTDNQITSQQQSVGLQKQLQAIHKAVVPQQYLSAHYLPFQVEGLSFWNGQPMITISMPGVNGQPFYKLIGQGNAYSCQAHASRHGCNAWTVKSIDVDAGIVIFINHVGQQVKVAL